MDSSLSENLSLMQRLTQLHNNADDVQQGILRDVTLLLNTKLNLHELGIYPELANTIINYGLPDFAEFEANTSQTANIIKQKIEKILVLHEPRLKDVSVTVTNFAKFSIGFTIDATYMIEPSPIKIKFDSKYQPDVQQFKVEEALHE